MSRRHHTLTEETFTPEPSEKSWFRRSLAIAAFTFVGVWVIVEALIGKNDLHTWQVLQYPNGTVEVRNMPGWYFKSLARITTYPRMITVYGTKDSIPESPQDDSVKVQFNDGGSAEISWVARVATPCLQVKKGVETETDLAVVAETLKRQREFHRQFTGNVTNAENAVRAAVRNIIQQSGPVMSSTENQSARKGEFWQLVHDQLKEGLYQMRAVEVKANTGVAEMIKAMQQREGGQAAGINPQGTRPQSIVLEEHSITTSETVVAAEVVRDPQTGRPIIATTTPLNQYSMELLQFSIIETDYDAETLQKFSDKKKLYLQAEESKARAIQNVQQRFQRVAQGEREVAEEEWKAEEERMRQRIQAETKQEREVTVKETLRIREETLALVEAVAKEKQEIGKQIAQVNAHTAKNEKTAAEILAQARERQIEIAGAISDHERGLAEIYVEETKQVTAALQNLKVPDIVIMTPEAFDPTKGSAMQQALPSLQLLQLFGLMEENRTLQVPPRKQATTTVATPAFHLQPQVKLVN